MRVKEPVPCFKYLKYPEVFLFIRIHDNILRNTYGILEPQRHEYVACSLIVHDLYILRLRCLTP